jgi:hypothetical protein
MKFVDIFEDILNEGSDGTIKCSHCDWKWRKSEGGKDLYVCHKCGHDNTPNSFDEFAEKRLKGATKITNQAKEKGGPSMLTYHHFNVKLPYYKKASEGKFDLNKSKSEFKTLVNQLCDIDENVKIKQIDFQKLVGKIEVLGELIINHR